MSLKDYIEELREERDRYLDISERSHRINDVAEAIAETRAWLLNRIIGELTEIENDQADLEKYTKAAVLHTMISQ